jgi:very-short-patch-repair endonuclease
MNLSFNDETIRVLGTSENPMFVVKDICNILGLTNVTETLRNIPEKWRSSVSLNENKYELLYLFISNFQMTNIFTCTENDKTIYCVRHICKFLNITNTTETTRRLDKSHIFNRKIKFGKSIQTGIMTDLYGLRFIITRTRSSKVKDLIQMLNINLDVVYSSDEAHFINIIEESFSECKIHKQFSIDIYRIDMYFIDYKIALEIDENNHINRDILYEEERQSFITNKLKCVFIRFNPNEKLFNIGKIIFQIREYIKNYQIE